MSDKKIDKKQLENLAKLARLSLTKEEGEKMVGEIGSIIDYCSQIQEIAGEEVTKSAGELRNVMRDDSDAHESGAYTDDLLAEAPQKDGGYVKVKKVL